MVAAQCGGWQQRDGGGCSASERLERTSPQRGAMRVIDYGRPAGRRRLCGDSVEAQAVQDATALATVKRRTEQTQL